MNTLIEHYGSLQNFYNERNLKTEKTCLEKYGAQHFFQKDVIKKKRAQTCLEKYGVTTVLNTKEARFKNNINSHTKKANQKRIESFFKNDLKELKEKREKTCLEKYGVKNPAQLKEVKEKVKQTCLSRYNVQSYSQSKEAQQSRKSQYFYDGLNFDSKPELCFYIYCKEQNLNVKRGSKPFEYNFEGQTQRYFPDFEIDGKYYEIKGNQFLTKEGKWCNPFNHSQDGKYEAKRQCAIKNNVIILYEKDYMKYEIYIKEKYGKDYLNQFKVKGELK